MSEENTKTETEGEIPEPVEQEPDQQTSESESPAPQPRKSGVLPMLLTGAIIASAGVGAGYYLSQNLPQSSETTDVLRTEMSDLTQRITALENAPVPEPAVSVSDLTELRSELRDTQSAMATNEGDLYARMDETLDTLNGLHARVNEFDRLLADMDRLIMNRTVASDQTVTEFREQVETLRDELSAVTNRLEAQAEASAQRAVAAQASSILTRVTDALESGDPFPELIDELDQTHGIAVPDALAEISQSGAPNVEDLLGSFPEYARAAIAASVREEVENGTISRFGGFMRTQFGARSLEPREGEDTDAILSRAEAALTAGDLTTSLSELSALPEVAAGVMADWSAQLEMLSEARAALGTLDAALRGE